ncbi:glycoside hydrolase family 72 protein [Polychaeton citri CBS 116435]|uniref:1,3-beta-glucanosyltransferase n=1 Tax=Polychaeton citri CBS 116435 TaxID=1314669 RepID=A0A9P4Q4V8_9PEZI|nr:glycoside hydrolase family 72 protein [Polychaeton citri CBS 116435]
MRYSATVALAATAYAVSPIEVQNQELIDTVSGQRFMIVGVDYQPGGQGAYTGNGEGSDPLSVPDACLRDAALMQNLGINTIRCYNVDPLLNHDECMSIFNSIGIYAIIDVNSPKNSLDRSNPGGSYNEDYLSHVFQNIEAFKNYPNTLGFFSGNEVMNDIPTSQDNPPYIRAVQRDMKDYIANHANRTIPVGYSAADVADILYDTWNYMQCSLGGNDNSQSDFFGLNDYSWCGSDSSYTISGYDQKVAHFANSSIPVFFSEYGCNKPSPRQFDEVLSLYGPEMTVMSGGLVYEWSQETSNYGLVDISANGSAQLLGDYNTLLSQYNKLNATLLTSQNSTATNIQPPTCDSGLITNDVFSTDFDIPSPPDGVSDLIQNGVSNAPSGSIVRVTQTSVGMAVFQTNGAPVENLQITPAASANQPGGGSLQTGSAPSSSSHASSTSAPSASSTSDSTASSTASSTSNDNAAAAATSDSAAVPLDLGVMGSGALAGIFGMAAFVL